MSARRWEAGGRFALFDGSAPCGRATAAPCSEGGACAHWDSARRRVGVARLVRPGAAGPAVAVCTGPSGRSLPGVAVGGHAAADHGQGGHSLLPGVSAPLAVGGGAGGGESERRSGRMGRTWLLQPRAQPARLRPTRRRAPRQQLPAIGGGPQGAAGHRPLYGRRHCRHRLRGAGDSCGRQCGAGCRPAVCGDAAIAGGQGRAAAAGRGADAGRSGPGITPRR